MKVDVMKIRSIAIFGYIKFIHVLLKIMEKY